MSELIIEIWFNPSADPEVAKKILPADETHIVEAQVAITAGTTITAAGTVTTAQVPGGAVEITKAVIKLIKGGAEIAMRVYAAAKILVAVLDLAGNWRSYRKNHSYAGAVFRNSS
jgi:hypothetical protein